MARGSGGYRGGFVQRIPARQLVARVATPVIPDFHLATGIRSVAYIAASLDPNISPIDALRGHLAVIPWLEPGLAPHAALYRQTLSRFLLSYWRASFDRAPFRFGVPRLLDRALNDLAKLPPHQATRPLVSELVIRLRRRSHSAPMQAHNTGYLQFVAPRNQVALRKTHTLHPLRCGWRSRCRSCRCCERMLSQHAPKSLAAHGGSKPLRDE